MTIDPRDPSPDAMVHTESTHPVHARMRKTLSLLRLADTYFVIEGINEYPCPYDELQSQNRFFYEEHTCPTSFIRIPLIVKDGDTDPHGLFEFIEAVWMTAEYEARTSNGDGPDYLVTVFPQLNSVEAKP